MYTLAIRRDFIAQHALIGGDWGAENQPHSHHYVLELHLEGAELDRHGYLVDIVEVEGHLTNLLVRYRGHFLNDFPEFSGLNPSLEHFARILCTGLNERISAPNISAIRVVLWEHENAWASYRLERSNV
jgi:6-pyruvoyltetrahydropterin/6-carboxytetrahydropterin synthase